MSSLLPTHNISLPPYPTRPLIIHTQQQQADLQFKRDNAWKYFGYPEFCRFVATQNDFFLLRRFGALNARALLTMQHKITELENVLEDLDSRCMNHENAESGRVNSLSWDKSFDNPWNARAKVVDDLQPLLHKYSTPSSTSHSLYLNQTTINANQTSIFQPTLLSATNNPRNPTRSPVSATGL